MSLCPLCAWPLSYVGVFSRFVVPVPPPKIPSKINGIGFFVYHDAAFSRFDLIDHVLLSPISFDDKALKTSVVFFFQCAFWSKVFYDVTLNTLTFVKELV